MHAMPCRPPQSPPIAKFMIANWALSKSQPAPPLPSPRQVGTSWRPASRKPTGAAPPANRLDLRHSRGGRGSAYASPLDLVYSRRIQTARTLRIARARPRPGSPKVARGRRPRGSEAQHLRPWRACHYPHLSASAGSKFPRLSCSPIERLTGRHLAHPPRPDDACSVDTEPRFKDVGNDKPGGVAECSVRGL